MPSAISRGPLSSYLIEQLQLLGFPVGDNSYPDEDHGWIGEPNSADATFIPFTTLTATAATPRAPMAMGDTTTEWSLGYNVFYAGVTRKQVDALADRNREHLVNLSRVDIETDTGTWKISKIECTSLGSSNRVGGPFPDYYTQSDSFDVWMSKNRR